MFTRRVLLVSAIAVGAAPAFAAAPFRNEGAAIEARLGGRIGATWLGPGGGTWTGHRQDERFAMGAAVNVFLVAATLWRARGNAFSLSDSIAFTQDDLVANSRVLEARLAGENGGAFARDELCVAALALGDNTAANLLLRDLGGPDALKRFMRSLGDKVTRMDRAEPEPNYHDRPDDVRDTSTPLAFARSLRKVLFGDGLAAPDARLLGDLMRVYRSMPDGIRSGVPTGWDIGVTPENGDAEAGSVNQAGFFKRPGARMQVLTVFVDAPNADIAACEAAIASVARMVAAKV
jgi:beta-lactamase class A